MALLLPHRYVEAQLANMMMSLYNNKSMECNFNNANISFNVTVRTSPMQLYFLRSALHPAATKHGCKVIRTSSKNDTDTITNNHIRFISIYKNRGLLPVNMVTLVFSNHCNITSLFITNHCHHSISKWNRLSQRAEQTD